MKILPDDLVLSLGELKPNVFAVLDTLKISETEVQDLEDRWGKLKIKPVGGDADSAKDLFLQTLSHELKTPLTSLLLEAQMLLHVGSFDPRVIRAGLSIEKAAKAQAQIIDDLFDISKIVNGSLHIEFKTVDLPSIIDSTIESVKEFAKIKCIVIESNINRSVASVSGDSKRLQQIVWNLLTNAIKFSVQGNRVLVTLEEVQGFAEIKVTDHGIGIADDFLPVIFARFCQADESAKRSCGGLGLGLAIAHQLVEMHGGTIKAESDGLGKGATFTVMIPRANTPAEKQAAQVH